MRTIPKEFEWRHTEVRFSRRSIAKTRHGLNKCIGLDILTGLRPGTIRLETVSTRQSGGSWVDIPDEDRGSVCLALWPKLTELIDPERLAAHLDDPTTKTFAEQEFRK